MKNAFLFLLGFLFLMQCSMGQECCNTLKVKCLWLEEWNPITYEYHELENLVLHPAKKSQILLGSLFEISDLYLFGDTITAKYIVTSGSDTIQCFTVAHVCDSGYSIGDSIGLIDYFWDIKSFAKGEYHLKFCVIYTSRDGYFCDSIVELSSKTVTFYVDTKAPVRETLAESTMNVFPNPASEHLNVTCGEEMRSIALFNTAGQRVRQMEPCGSEVQIPLSGLPRGLYLLRVQTANGSAVRKVVVE